MVPGFVPLPNSQIGIPQYQVQLFDRLIYRIAESPVLSGSGALKRLPIITGIPSIGYDILEIVSRIYFGCLRLHEEASSTRFLQFD
tara:strand:- start:12 stop:269 length:258 start_codon:yes stop_codon:yes gene_type:complete